MANRRQITPVQLGLLLLILVAAAALAWRLARTPASRPGDAPATTATDPGSTRVVDHVAQVSAPRLDQQRDHDAAQLNPANDGWDTEAVAERTKAQLDKLAKIVSRTDGQPVTADELAPLIAPDFTCQSLRPEDLRVVFEDAAVVVRRPEAAAGKETGEAFDGAIGFAEALNRWAQPLRGGSHSHAKVKTVHVALTPTAATTTSYFEAGVRSDTKTVQQTATWHAQWARSGADPPRLTSLRVENYEEVAATGPDGRWFADCTQAVLGENQSYKQQLGYGLNHWLQRIERVHRMDDSVRNGLAVADVNGDGLEDVYVCQGPGLPNRLFIQNPNGTATDRSAAYGVDWLDHTSSALFLDMDNDGDQDLVLATSSRIIVMENDAGRRYKVKTGMDSVGLDVQSLAAADYDDDGDLDVFVCVYRPNPGESTAGFTYHDARTGGRNKLYRNDLQAQQDAWRFTDVTETVGLDVGSNRYSYAAAWEDYDNDGDQDLYVANDFGRNYLYRNDGGRFVDVAEATGVLDIGPGMSASFGDYNRDGWMDLYVGNMYSSAGQRVARLARFRSGDDAPTRQTYVRFAKGNSLFAGGPGGRFREVGTEARVELGRWAWSSVFVDLNNDGWQDILVANGFITTEDTGDL